MSDQNPPQSSDDWTKLWQERGRHQNEYAVKEPGQVPYGFGDYSQRFGYAAWPSRVAGTLIDVLFALCLQVLVGVIVWAATGDLMTAVIGAYAVGFLLNLWFQWRNGSTGQTPGKAVMRIRVVREADGTTLGGPMGLLRGLVGWAISAFTCGLAGLLDVLWPLFDEKNRTIHDMIVGSVVIRDRAF